MQLHTNYDNCPAQTIYSLCGFRCDQFTFNGYPKTFEPEFAHNHMIRMELNFSHIIDYRDLCFNRDAVSVPHGVEVRSSKLCDPNETAPKVCMENIRRNRSIFFY